MTSERQKEPSQRGDGMELYPAEYRQTHKAFSPPNTSLDNSIKLKEEENVQAFGISLQSLKK